MREHMSRIREKYEQSNLRSIVEIVSQEWFVFSQAEEEWRRRQWLTRENKNTPLP